MQTTSASTTAESGANLRHLAVRSSDDHIRIGDDVELNNLPCKDSDVHKGASQLNSSTGTPNSGTVAQTEAQRLRARIQFATLCWTLYLAGWNDGSTGPLLPRIQKVYNVGVLGGTVKFQRIIDMNTHDRSTLQWSP